MMNYLNKARSTNVRRSARLQDGDKLTKVNSCRHHARDCNIFYASRKSTHSQLFTVNFRIMCLSFFMKANISIKRSKRNLKNTISKRKNLFCFSFFLPCSLQLIANEMPPSEVCLNKRNKKAIKGKTKQMREQYLESLDKEGKSKVSQTSTFARVIIGSSSLNTSHKN